MLRSGAARYSRLLFMSACPQCRQSIRWERRGSKWYALNADGITHWATCKRARAPKPGAVLHQVSKVIRGEHYRPSCGGCDLPPWERCVCSFHEPDAVAEVNAEADRRLELALSD